MKKLILSASLVVMGMMTACQKDELVPEGTKPSWLGESIYEELRSGTHLTGTFDNYLRLIDDLGYAEVLSRTGSKTIFPANDEAFERFFQNNPYGIKSYEDLDKREGLKKQLLYSSMLDNAMLAGMLSNVEKDANNVNRGVAIKHETNISITDTITYIFDGDKMPQNNYYWDSFRNKGIHVVYDATKPMMIHFTREQMLNNAITTNGTDSDFGILRGEPVGTTVVNSDTAYIFQNKIINQDIVCTNGYIHQVSDVLVPVGNVAQVMREEAARPDGNLKFMSRIIDYFCAPFYDANTTNNYNAWARQNGRPTIDDSIYQVRYFSERSQGGSVLNLEPTGGTGAQTKRLEWDLGWNQYYSSVNSLADMGAILAPTDDVIAEYFGPNGDGAYFIELYGDLPNTRENLEANLDALHNKGNGILTAFVNNMLQSSFVASVPSKFGTLTDDGSGDFMGLSKKDLAVTADGRYDVKVANNGVIYKMNRMIAPNQYLSVLGPAITYPDLSVIGYFTQDRVTGSKPSLFGAEMYYYLMAMKANYLYFIPSNEGLAKCFIDPVSLGSANPSALEFYAYEDYAPGSETQMKTYYGVKIHDFNPETGEINPAVRNTVLDLSPSSTSSSTSSEYASQVHDLLNYNTVVLEAGEEITNNYYLTKHGGAIRISDLSFDNDGRIVSGQVSGGAQIDNNMEPAKIEKVWPEQNGWAFRLDNVIQPSITSVSKLLYNHMDRFSSFLEMCAIFDDPNVLEWAGIKGTVEQGTAPQERYIVFSPKGNKALDMNVNFFNGYNYTFYAPDNEAMEAAYAMGLPKTEEIYEDYNTYGLNEEDYPDDEVLAAKTRVLLKLNALRAFVRYHFQNNSVFADNYVENITYQSLYSSDLGIPVNINLESTDGILTVKDASGRTIQIDANDTKRLVNKMTRDYEYDQEKESATAIAVSSFAAVHQVSIPLCFNASKRYDDAWKSPAAMNAAVQNYPQLVKTANNYKD